MEEVATAREQLAAAEAAASEGAVSAARAARLGGELREAHAEIRRLSELEGNDSCLLNVSRVPRQLSCRIGELQEGHAKIRRL